MKANKKAIVYIDGFNLYYGIKKLNRPELKWLDIQALSASFLKADTTLSEVKYFTSHIARNNEIIKRQNVYLEALNTLTNVSIFYGHFLSKDILCRKCNHSIRTNEEKQTDVNIACELLADAYENNFDVAFVVSGDSDLVPPVKKVITMGKPVTVAFPPNRKSEELKKTATNVRHINIRHLKRNLLPLEITTKNNKKITCPPVWQKTH